jgi:hypothetical protein
MSLFRQFRADPSEQSELRARGDVPLGEPARLLRILFSVSAHRGLSQRAWIALTDLGHQISVAVVESAAAMEAAVRKHDPQLIACPF